MPRSNRHHPPPPRRRRDEPRADRRFTYRLDLEYEGSRYRGWQIQQNAVSVAGALTRAFEELELGLSDLGGAGRTDAGVHALHQVAHARLAHNVDPERLRADLEERLPFDIAVRRVARVSPRFHARHDAVSRSYLFQISRRRTAFGKRLVWWVRDSLDPKAMQRAAVAAVGRHDFVRFCAAPNQQDSTIVHVEDCRVVTEGDLILVRVAASHFLWRMVRRLVGFLVEVGAGRLPEDALAHVLAGGLPEVDTATFTAPPSGLFLERVSYPGDPPLLEPKGVLRVG